MSPCRPTCPFVSPLFSALQVDSGALNEAEGQETHGRGRGGGPVFHVRGEARESETAGSVGLCWRMRRPTRTGAAAIVAPQSLSLSDGSSPWTSGFGRSRLRAPSAALQLRAGCSAHSGGWPAAHAPTWCVCFPPALPAGLTLTEEYASIRTILRIPGGNPFAIQRQPVAVGPTRCEVTGILVRRQLWVGRQRAHPTVARGLHPSTESRAQHAAWMLWHAAHAPLLCWRLTPHACRASPALAVQVVYGLPRLLTGSILAHEVMHAWLRLSGCTRLPEQVEEGLCQLMALLWLEAQADKVRGGGGGGGGGGGPSCTPLRSACQH